jgi:hypothetical protein
MLEPKVQDGNQWQRAVAIRSSAKACMPRTAHGGLQHRQLGPKLPQLLCQVLVVLLQLGLQQLVRLSRSLFLRLHVIGQPGQRLAKGPASGGKASWTTFLFFLLRLASASFAFSRPAARPQRAGARARHWKSGRYVAARRGGRAALLAVRAAVGALIGSTAAPLEASRLL